MGIVGRIIGPFRRKKKLTIAPLITSGSMLPDVEVEVIADGCVAEEQTGGLGCQTLPLNEVLSKGRTVLVGMPGAFTPTCSSEHLPGFIKSSSALKAAGVTQVAVITTNDRYVNEAWAEAMATCMGEQNEMTLLSDADGEALRALGLAEDMGFGFNVRSKRFAIVAEEGVVSHVAVDEGMDELNTTSAEAVLQVVAPKQAAGGMLDDLTEEQKVGVAIGALLLIALVASIGGDGGATTDAAATTAAAMAANKAVAAKVAAASKASTAAPAKKALGATVSNMRSASGYQMLQ